MDTQRDTFFNRLYELAVDNRDIVLITADCGAPSLDQWRLDIPTQIINCGIAEQNMISLAAGMALEGKKPYCYAIAPFATLRCLEQIKVNLCCRPRPVTIVGVGAGFSYDVSGPTHHATEDIGVMRALPEMTIFNPADNVTAQALVDITYHLPGPAYVRLDRKPMPNLYMTVSGEGWTVTKGSEESSLLIVATGNMVHMAREIAKRFQTPSVVDLYQLKPVPIRFIQYLKDFNRGFQDSIQAPIEGLTVITLEEHVLSGGLGSILAEVKADEDLDWKLVRLGIPDHYYFSYGGRPALIEKANLDLNTLVERIKGID